MKHFFLSVKNTVIWFWRQLRWPSMLYLCNSSIFEFVKWKFGMWSYNKKSKSSYWNISFLVSEAVLVIGNIWIRTVLGFRQKIYPRERTTTCIPVLNSYTSCLSCIKGLKLLNNVRDIEYLHRLIDTKKQHL